MKVAKKVLRSQMRNALLQLTSDQRERESKSVIQQVIQSDLYKTFQNICCYIPMIQQEIDTTPLILDAIRSGKKLYVPVIQDSNMYMVKVRDEQDFESFVSNKWSILEPTKESLPDREYG